MNELLQAAKCALADLEGILPQYDPERSHPGWKTVKELRKAIRDTERMLKHYVPCWASQKENAC